MGGMKDRRGALIHLDPRWEEPHPKQGTYVFYQRTRIIPAFVAHSFIQRQLINPPYSTFPQCTLLLYATLGPISIFLLFHKYRVIATTGVNSIPTCNPYPYHHRVNIMHRHRRHRHTIRTSPSFFPEISVGSDAFCRPSNSEDVYDVPLSTLVIDT